VSVWGVAKGERGSSCRQGSPRHPTKLRQGLGKGGKKRRGETKNLMDVSDDTPKESNERSIVLGMVLRWCKGRGKGTNKAIIRQASFYYGKKKKQPKKIAPSILNREGGGPEFIFGYTVFVRCHGGRKKVLQKPKNR